MSSLFSKPKAPVIQMAPPPPPVPTYDEAYQGEEYSRKLKRRRGHAANNYVGAGGAAGAAARAVLG